MSIFDGLFLFLAISLNILIILIFLARYRGPEGLEHKIGYAVIVCIIPFTIILLNYILIGKDLWIVIYIIIIISFLIFEMILDYILKLNFRTNPKIVGPYVLFYYIAFWGLLAISFVIDLLIGFVVFGIFMLSVVVTIYTHKKQKDKMFKK
ncbi:MAG: hypothetical protein EU533_00695 [Promethearchaeota archaeon]|nr:MAG: hypothetical protein EU533_00695 [Candidatus Lokiarchaeota archaeon]